MGDSRGLGSMSLDEFMSKGRPPQEDTEPEVPIVTSEKIAKSFLAYDTNKDGTINRAELRRLFIMLDTSGNFTESELDAIMDELDYTNDGVIDYKEFSTWLKKGSKTEAEKRISQLKVAVGKFETLEEKIARLEEELRQSEEAATLSNAVEVDIGEKDLWMFTGIGETVTSLCSSGKPLVVKQISPIMEAFEKGVRIGFRVSGVGGRSVPLSVNIMRRLLRSCGGDTKRKLPVKFVSPATVTLYEDSVEAVPRLQFALEETRAEVALRDGMGEFLGSIRRDSQKDKLRE